MNFEKINDVIMKSFWILFRITKYVLGSLFFIFSINGVCLFYKRKIKMKYRIILQLFLYLTFVSSTYLLVLFANKILFGIIITLLYIGFIETYVNVVILTCDNDGFWNNMKYAFVVQSSFQDSMWIAIIVNWILFFASYFIYPIMIFFIPIIKYAVVKFMFEEKIKYTTKENKEPTITTNPQQG